MAERGNGPVVVAGGGVIGLLAARELAIAGERVMLVERGRTGREASWAGGGILSPLYPWRFPQPVNRLAALSQRMYPVLARALAEDTGIDPQCVLSGMLALDPDDTIVAARWGREYAGIMGEILGTDGETGPADQPGPWLQIVDSQRAVELEPALGHVTDPTLWLPHVGHVRTPRLLTALRADLLRRGVEIREEIEVTGFRTLGDRLVGLHTTGEDIACRVCVVATGAWTGGLLADSGLKLPVRPVRGQMILLATRPGSIRRIVLRAGRYAIPRRDGLVLVGSTLEESGFEAETTEAARVNLHRFAAELLPPLRDAAIRQHWAGLRPATPDGLPYVGPHPGIEGLHVSAGHYRNGLVLAPASARLTAAAILGSEPPLDPAPFRLTREPPGTSGDG